jgi:Alpha-L-arabinofuranosidase
MKATIACTHPIAQVDDRLYSSFIEHMGRAVYTGIYEPSHPTADKFGFRGDVSALIRPLRLSHIRYPGGNFLSGYRWRDGIGPKSERPVRPELAWFAIEPNEVGTDEFLQWCERLDIRPMLGVNLGTGTAQDALDLLEYVNGTHGTYYADLRRKNGRAAPYGVKLWCLGNEMDGPWQICTKTAEEYGRIACETAKMMKWFDPSIELVACGSSYRAMPTFGAWEKTVLAHCYPHIDYISLHQYYTNETDDIPSFLARSLEMEDSIREIGAICDEARRAQNGSHDVALSFDEWNVWYHFRQSGLEPPKWTVGRPIEEELFDDVDPLVTGSMMNTLLRNADRVRIACLAQLVNVIAPIMTEPGGRAWVQTIYEPFRCASLYGRGISMLPEVTVPSYNCAIRENVPYLDCAAVRNDDGALTFFLVNRNGKERLEATLHLDRAYSAAHLQTLRGAALYPLDCRLCPDHAEFSLPRHSWSMLRLLPEKA